ncbi:DUF6286 domain-containing protein [Herbidospora daliensis]|uniref:DUF6286 domain-containing protein n=1 Tax=Herbidospora daliensis TaxID=295585 RepID=UPI0012FBFED8|nr:DUF6286 domain-containing protein [Herbidospora daliensis]
MTTLHTGADLPDTPEPASRASARGKGARRFLRPRRKVPAAIAAFVLFVVGLLIAVGTISALFGHPVRIVPYDRVVDWARASTWQDDVVMAAAAVIGIVGALLILIAAIPGRTRLVALRSGEPDMIIGTSRRMLARVLGTVAAQVDGVRQARARIRGRQVTVHAGTDLRDTAAVRERVRDAVEGELARLAPVGRYTVKTKVRGAP